MSAPSDLTTATPTDIKLELARRRLRGQILLRKRVKLLEEIAALDVELGKRASKTGGATIRARNEKSLVEMLAQVLDGKTMSPTEATEQVLLAGFKTHNATFHIAVGSTLSQRTDWFRRVDKGMYTAR